MTLLYVCLSATNTPVTSPEFYVSSHWERNDVLHGKCTKGNINLGNFLRNDLQRSISSRQCHLKVMKLTANMEHEQSFGWCQQDSAHPTLLLAMTCSKCHVQGDTENSGSSIWSWGDRFSSNSPPTTYNSRWKAWFWFPFRTGVANPRLWSHMWLFPSSAVEVIFSMWHYVGDQGDLVTLK